MHPEFWHQRWQRGETGFHQDRVNDTLTEHWPSLDLPEGSRVLVPLCGMSRDMAWLREQGHEVIGVELSAVAIRRFFEDEGEEPVVGFFGPYTAWRGERLLILEGDIFDLPPDMKAAAIYDRAATIALPLGMRDQYAEVLARAVAPGAPVLMSTLDYPQHEKDGPPFSVSPEEVERLYGEAFVVEHLHHEDAPEGQREAWSLSRLAQDAWRLVRR